MSAETEGGLRQAPVSCVQEAAGSRVRLSVLALLATATTINYLDRAIVGIAAPSMSAELGIGAATMGLVFSAFSWSYVAMQVPAGILLDRFGSRLTYLVSTAGWSLATLLHSLANGLGTLLGLRLLLGFTESACFPANNRIVATWFPQQERARATGVYTIGEYVGLAFLTPVLLLLLKHAGWRTLFLLCGALGLLFSLVWWRRYREPHQEPRLSASELAHIKAGGGLAMEAAGTATRFRWCDLRRLLRFRQIWGACIGQFASNATLVFFLTWFPTYLVREHHVPLEQMTYLSTAPFIAAALGVGVGSLASDFLTRRLGNPTYGCKLPIAIGLLLCSTAVAANFSHDKRVVIAFMSLAFFGQGMASLGWAVISNIAPARLLGLTGGLFSLAANLAGILTPLLMGWIVECTGSFFWALCFNSATALAGVLAYVFLLTEVKRLEVPE